jgi:hypothetical protein
MGVDHTHRPLRPTLEDETDAKLGGRRHRGRSSSWCSEPENELDPGHFEHP